MEEEKLEASKASLSEKQLDDLQWAKEFMERYERRIKSKAR